MLLQYNEYVTFIENLLSSNGGGLGDDDAHKTEGSMQVILLRGLLQAFDKKFWVTVTSILLRIWKVSLTLLLLLLSFRVASKIIAIFRELGYDKIR